MVDGSRCPSVTELESSVQAGTVRPHRSLNLVAPDAPLGPRLGHGEVICRRRLDGLINEYTRAA